VRGEIQADDLQNATALLKARAIFPTAVTPAKEKSATPARRRLFSGGNMAADVSILTRQLANLIGGGVPMMSAFAALTGHTENERLRTVLEQMQDEVRGGKSLWEALGEHPDVFPTLYVNMVKAGEASGQLSSVLAWLADYQEKEQARRMQIRGALVYPLVLLSAGLLAIVILITVVVPKFTGMYSEFGQALPAPTVLLLAISGFLAHWGWAILVGVALLVAGVRRYEKTPSGTLRIDALRLRLPLLGKLTMKSAMSRFARTTTTLMQGGVPLLEALSVVRDVLGNEVLAQATDHAREGMREGERFGERLHATGQFPPLLTHMIGIGEETGDLRNMLNTVANTYDIEVDATLRALVSLLEPIIIVGIGSVMAFVIIAMLLPIFQIDMVGGG
jgi:type II secretory pathway component PulF